MVALVGEVLGSNVVGAYLLGSAVTGGLRPRSDLDVLVVSERPLSEAEKRELVGRILPISWRETPQGMLRGIELTVVVQSSVRPWRYPPRRDFQYGGWLRLALDRGEPAPWAATTDPDLASLITQARAADVALLGGSAKDVLDPVPFGDVLDAIVAGVDEWVGNIASDTRNAILALARIWSALETGALSPKDVAATWALGRLPGADRPVLARARSIYLGEADDEWDDVRDDVDRYVRYVADEIERASTRNTRSRL